MSANTAARPRVLIVDDDAATRLLTRTCLTGAGFDTEMAADGQEGLERFRASPPDVVLLDVSMPGMDGFTLCSLIRTLPEGQDVPVLMLTGMDDVESINRAFEMGATEFITKPINWTLLGHRVRYSLRASRAMAELKRSEQRLKNAQRIAQIGDWEFDPGQEKFFLSEQASHILGLEAAAGPVALSAFLRSVHYDDVGKVHATIRDAVGTGQAIDLEHRILLPDGVERVVHQQGEVTARGQAHAATWMVGTTHDVTDRRRSEERIRQLAYFDPLTYLPNRTLLTERMQAALDSAARRNERVAVMFLDLDNFKIINDTLGHVVGDALLEAVAKRLTHCVRTGASQRQGRGLLDGADATTIARLGGDEFTLLLHDMRDAEDARTVARRVLETIARPLVVKGHEVFVSASIGIAVFPDDGRDVDELLASADAAMYHAKEQGRNNFQFYSRTMSHLARERLALENGLRKALKRGEFRLFYQPKVSVASGRIVGLEALMRWHSADFGMVPPSDFIPVAERMGLIVPMGEWLIGEACRQASAWRDAGLPRLPIAVNISSLQFRRGNLVEAAKRAMVAHRCAADMLEMEVTESLLMQDLDIVLPILRALADMGVHLAMDDFGTGYSSFTYLKQLPLHTLKIDQSFIRGVVQNADDGAITAALIAMAHSLKLTVVAEGVEQAEQLVFLRDKGCDQFQGHLFSPAVDPEQLATMLAAQTRAGNEGAARPRDATDESPAVKPLNAV